MKKRNETNKTKKKKKEYTKQDVSQKDAEQNEWHINWGVKFLYENPILTS